MQGFVLWINSLLVKRLLCYLHKDFCSGLFYALVVVMLCLNESFCIGLMLFNKVVVMLLCCLHKDSCFFVRLLFFLHKVVGEVSNTI